MIHELKIWPGYFTDIKSGLKTFDVRKNDRDYKVGDELLLREWIPPLYSPSGELSVKSNAFTGEIIHRRTTYILEGGQFGIQAGYVVLGLEKI